LWFLGVDLAFLFEILTAEFVGAVIRFPRQLRDLKKVRRNEVVRSLGYDHHSASQQQDTTGRHIRPH
jgi:hypothetical protein